MRKLIPLSILVFAACADEPSAPSPTVANQELVTSEDTPATFTFAVSGADPAAMTVTMGHAEHGTLAGAGMQWTYTPDADYSGDDVVTATVGDGVHTTTAKVAIQIAPVNDAPVSRHDVFAARQDVALRLTAAALVANDRDVDGDDLTVVAVHAGREGDVTLDDGLVTFSLPPGWNGITGFTYTVTDGAQTVPGVVTVVVGASDQPPSAGADRVDTEEDTYINVAAAALLANDVDPNGDTLFITAVGGAHGGTVVLAGDAVVFVPTADFDGHGSFEYTVSDGAHDAVGHVEVVVAAVDDAPVAGADEAVVTEDVPLAIATADLIANDVDAEGDALTVTAVDGAYGGYVALDGGIVTFTPGPDFHGAAGFTYTVTDGTTSATGACRLIVAAVADAPIALDDTLTTDEDVAIDIPLASLTDNDHDADGDPLAVVALGDAAGGKVAMGGGPVATFTPTPDYHGVASFTYTISDGTDTAIATVAILVAPINDAPVAIAFTTITSTETPVDVALAGTDVDGDPLTYAIVIAPSHGDLTGTGGHLTYVPDGGFHGEDAFAYQVDDGTVASAPAIATVIVSERAFVTTDPVLVSADRSCTTSDSHRGRKVAVDSAGDVYAVMRCDGAAFVAVSGDRGKLFGAPVALGVGDTGELAVATGGPGVAYVVALADGAVRFTRTVDAGKTWSAPVAVGPAFGGELSIDAAGDDVYLGTGALGAITVRHNAAGGDGPWAETTIAMPYVSFDLLHDTVTGALLIGSDSPALDLRISADLGVSFGADVTPIASALDADWAIGGGALFAVGTAPGTDVVQAFTAGGASVSRVVGGLPTDGLAGQRAIAADVSGSAYVATARATGGVQLDRLAGGSISLAAPRAFGDGASYPAVTGLPFGAGVAMLYSSGTSVYATIQAY